eukprot:609320-Rhodomonas_salina.2
MRCQARKHPASPLELTLNKGKKKKKDAQHPCGPHGHRALGCTTNSPELHVDLAPRLPVPSCCQGRLTGRRRGSGCWGRRGDWQAPLSFPFRPALVLRQATAPG